MTIYAISSQKGGVGKTTTAINLAESLAQDRSVLLIDLDHQGNATAASGIRKPDRTIHDVLTGVRDLDSAITSTKRGHYDFVCASPQLTAIAATAAPHLLRDALRDVVDKYDYIILDCPPSLDAMTMNAYLAADEVIVPVQCEFFALEGVAGLVKTVRQIRDSHNPRLIIGGLLRTMFETRSGMSTRVSDMIKAHFQSKVFDTVIPRNITISEAHGYGVPVYVLDPQAKGAVAYMRLAAEILAREVAA